MLGKVRKYIDKHSMIKKGDGIVVGLSGGPDSVCLLHVLSSLREEYDISLYAVHLNHMIRGEEAIRDEKHARDFAESLKVPFFSESIAVEEYAKQNKMSSEEAGRYLRYRLFNEVAKKYEASKIALAHNMNDQAETMIMRFLRGTGISGLKGISPVREGRYIRPILSCTREEIEAYCRDKALNPVIDSTNAKSIYTRNKVRLEIIPYIRKHFNPNIISNLFNNSEIIRDEDDFINNLSREKYEAMRISGGIRIEDFNLLHRAMKRRIIRLLIEEFRGNLNQIESKHIEDCIDFIEGSGTGKLISLPGGVNGRIEYDAFKISKTEARENFEEEVLIPGITRISDASVSIKTRILSGNSDNLRENKNVKYFDYNKIKGTLTIRNRREGDYIYPKGMSGRKKLKDIFIDKKIPREEREKMPLIALEDEILWAIGMRDTRNYKINENTERILEIYFEGGINNEEGNKENSIK